MHYSMTVAVVKFLSLALLEELVTARQQLRQNMFLQVTAALEEDHHFFALADSKWCLAVYQPLRWGFAGTSKIAEDFISALCLVPGAELMTAAARKKDRLPQAQEFAKKHGRSSLRYMYNMQHLLALTSWPLI